MHKGLRVCLLAALLLAACSGAPETPAGDASTVEAPALAATNTAVSVAQASAATDTAEPATAAPAEPTDAAPAAEPSITPEQPAPTLAAVAEPPPLDQFVATDPSTVNLAAGKPQLVEFFAVW